MNETPDELRARIERLERELARVKTERDLFKQTVLNDREPIPYTPMTLEEARELMTAPQGGETILDIIAEYEKELLARE